MVTRTQEHNETGQAFLARARASLAEDDLLQASEKGWGAAARMVKAVAESRGWRHNSHRDLYVTINRLVAESGDESRGWRHNSHRDLYVTINRLVAESGDESLRIGFGLASTLHTNFYEGWLPGETVAAHLDRVGELVERLDALTGDAPA